MISDEALREREWGHFPALRQALEHSLIPEHYYGWTSVSDNIFDQVSRLMKQAILVREHGGKIIETAAATGKNQMREDLRRLEAAFAQAEAQFEDARRASKELEQSL